MLNVGIVGGGPVSEVPDLHKFKQDNFIWIGADRGNLTLLKQGIQPDYAVGDFDSIKQKDMDMIKNYATFVETFPTEKDETDLEIAVNKALAIHADWVYLFGVTGGRLDHELINIQLLYRLHSLGIEGAIVNKGNWMELKMPGTHQIKKDPEYPYISFVPLNLEIKGLTLNGFYYPLKNQTVPIGSTLCISNKLTEKIGTFSFTDGILLLIKSRDVQG